MELVEEKDRFWSTLIPQRTGSLSLRAPRSRWSVALLVLVWRSSMPTHIPLGLWWVCTRNGLGYGRWFPSYSGCWGYGEFCSCPSGTVRGDGMGHWRGGVRLLPGHRMGTPEVRFGGSLPAGDPIHSSCSSSPGCAFWPAGAAVMSFKTLSQNCLSKFQITYEENLRHF